MLLAFAAALCVAALAPAAASAAPTGSIEGTVIGADTQEGIEGVEVCAYGFELEVEEEFFFDCVFTGTDGTYAIEEVPAGEYEIEFWAEGTGYLSRYYPDFVTVGTGAVTGIDIELSRASIIAGTVTRSSDEEPVEEVEVCAWGIEEEEPGGCTETGFDGTYELEVPPGEWGVEFWPAFSGQNLTYQFFNHRVRWSEADPVLIEEGETVEEIDAVLDPGATISGRVTSAADGAGLEEILVCAIDASTDQLTVCARTFEGDYEIPFLPAGQYKVVFSLDRNEWFGVEFFEDADGFPTQFWNNQTTLGAASVIPLGLGQVAPGIDAKLGTAPSAGGGGQPPVSATTPPIVLPSPTTAVPRPKKHCRKGFKRKKVKGKYRCVKPKKHRRHGHGRAARPSAPFLSGATMPPGASSRPLVRVIH